MPTTENHKIWWPSLVRPPFIKVQVSEVFGTGLLHFLGRHIVGVFGQPRTMGDSVAAPTKRDKVMQGVVAALGAVAVVMDLQGAGIVAEGAAEAVTGVDGAAGSNSA